MKNKRITVFSVVVLTIGLYLVTSHPAYSQNTDAPTIGYLKHCGGNILIKDTNGRAILQSPDLADEQQLRFILGNDGAYIISCQDGSCLTLSGQWDTFFEENSSTDNAKYTIETVNEHFVRLKCKANGKYLGVDQTTAGAYVYSDKDGRQSNHYWYITTDPYEAIPTDTVRFVINPEARRQLFKGWGVSLCWWANMCGKWSDEKIDEIIEWLVSPSGLNFSIFRYNIGGGDDPLNRNCTPHHMGNGKGLRAEMDGFKDAPDAEYDWSKDEAQRKIMLKIKEKRPDAIFEAFSNSCPYYMTYSGCCAGNTDAAKDNLRPEYYEAFAHYLVDVCKHYKDTYGIEFRTLEPFNEPMTNYWGANSGQEGCHFDYNSQIAFLKILSPILKASGLNTVISASDETSVSQSVTGFETYKNAEILNLIGQWNVHTYSAEHASRCKISALCKDAGIPLWMSEVGAGGNGFSGNLNLAQKLMDDIRYIMPEAWLDWQYIEEGNDQWCMVQGNFAQQTYEKVKNYYVRQHFSKYIKEGYTILTSPHEQTLSARNPNGDTLVIVTINTSGIDTYHQADLSFYETIGNSVTMLLTTQEKDMELCENVTIENNSLMYKMPELSIATIIIPVKERQQADEPVLLCNDCTYAIIPRAASQMAIQTQDNHVTIAENKLLPEQYWTLNEENGLWSFTNNKGYIITYNDSYYLTAQKEQSTGQLFQITHIDDVFCKISTPDNNRSFDLENENLSAGTNIGLWEYGNTPTAYHRQWQLLRIPKEELQPDGIAILPDSNNNNLITIRNSSGQIDITQNQQGIGLLSIFSVNGELLYHNHLVTCHIRIPLKKGIYLIKYSQNQFKQLQTVCIP